MILRVAALMLTIAIGVSGCAGTKWPDEPGVPVALSRDANVQAEETFLSTLTARRQAVSLPPPLVTPRYQSEIRAFAEDLQTGKISADGAQHAVKKWAAAAYKRPVTAWVIDCAPGSAMEIPAKLVQEPAAVISYAAAHFRPRSAANDQCAILLVAAEGSESVLLPENL